GTAASAVDLHPTNLANSIASALQGTDGTHQVGYADFFFSFEQGTVEHAMLWSGTAASAVDLHPTNSSLDILNSQALRGAGQQQVGWGFYVGGPNAGSHALLWTGTAASTVDLNPTALFGGNETFSFANATNGSQQVGYGYFVKDGFAGDDIA